MPEELPISISTDRAGLLSSGADAVMIGTSSATGAFSLTDVPALTAALRRGDEAAFTWLHQQWSARINRHCFALAAGEVALASEISQAVWLRLVRHIRVLPDEAALWSWIACAARHAAADFRRTGGRYRRALARFADWWNRPSIDERDDSLLSALAKAMESLSADERALIEARYFTEHSLEMIATQHALSARAVEGRLARLRDRLRTLIARQLQQL